MITRVIAGCRKLPTPRNAPGTAATDSGDPPWTPSRQSWQRVEPSLARTSAIPPPQATHGIREAVTSERSLRGLPTGLSG